MAIRTPNGEWQDPGSPVRRIPTDPVQADPADGTALCLSGGGYRAMLFHLGALWRLNEFGFLPKIDRISSVSGGSITAGVLAMNWHKLDFDSSGIGQRFEEVVVKPIRGLAARTIDVPAILLGFLKLGLGGSQTAAFYKSVYDGATLQDIPDRPRFVINSTSLQSEVLWRFSKPYMWDYRVGKVPNPQVPLAVAVAASSAFPPFLSPLELRLQPQSFEPGTGTDLQKEPFTSRVRLTDGGVYDNLGLETAWKVCKTILISDACGSSGADPRPASFWPLQLIRVLMEIDNQVGSLRKRQAIDGFISKHRIGTYWGIASHIDDYGAAGSLPAPAAATQKLAGVATRLARLDEKTQQRLINWGYAICDVAIRRHVDPTLPAPTKYPYRKAGVG